MTAVSVQRISHYRIQKRIGRGGMGVVYRAVDERDGRIVALKVIRETEASTEESAPHIAEARVRFQREADILQGLLHVNIVSFYEIGEEDGTPYLAMEYLDGQPITSYAGRPFPETVPLLIQAAHGLEYLGTRGIVHRDLSPDNIFVTESAGERIVKLLDFGVAKLFESPTGHESLTATGFFLGKVAYGSPEQLGSLGHGATLDFRSDIYSLGVIFYQVLSGHRPFDGKAPVEYIAAHLNVEAPPVAAPAEAPPLPMDLVRLISQMLRKRREERPSYRETIDRLVAVLREPGRTTTRPGLRADVPPESAPPTRTTGDAGTDATSLVGKDASITNEETLPSHTPSPRARLARAALGLVLLAVMLVALVLRIVLKTREPDATPSRRPRPVATAAAARTPVRSAEPTPVAASMTAEAPSSGLRILATPYARVLSITEVATGRRLALDAGATTPLLLSPLPPGVYRVTLICPALGEKARPVEHEVRAEPGRPALLNVPFLTPKELMEMMK